MGTTFFLHYAFSRRFYPKRLTFWIHYPKRLYIFCQYAEFGLHDLLHAIVMRISSIKTVLWLAVNLHQLFFQMERYLIQRAEVHWQATQFTLRIADESHAIVNVRLRSLSATYRAALEGILFIRSQHYCKLSNLTDKKRSAELDL